MALGIVLVITGHADEVFQSFLLATILKKLSPARESLKPELFSAQCVDQRYWSHHLSLSLYNALEMDRLLPLDQSPGGKHFSD